MKIGGHEWLIGADPEVFIRSKVTGKLVSAHGMLPGDKKNPFPVKYGAVQVDGMAAEFNIDPARTAEEFVRNVKSVMATLGKMIGDEYELAIVPTAHFGSELIDAQPEEAKILGCDPDYSAWTSRQNDAPDVDTPYRTGAGHIHIGWTKDADANSQQHRDICEHLIRTLDMYTSPLLRLEDDVLRRKLYGKQGSYRPKSYGCEYRTPSNVWLTNEKTMRLMFQMVRTAIIACVKGKLEVPDKGREWRFDDMYSNGRDGMGYSGKSTVAKALRAVVGDDKYV